MERRHWVRIHKVGPLGSTSHNAGERGARKHKAVLARSRIANRE